MKMATLTSEHDLWQLFGGDGPETQGAKELTYADFFNRTSVLDISGKKIFRPRFRVSDTNHLYLLRSPTIEAVVDQARLYIGVCQRSCPVISCGVSAF